MNVIRRQLFLLFVVGCAVSLAAEGRVVPWLVLDAWVSAAFMPVVQLLGFALIWRARIGKSAARQDDVLRFLDGNSPWLWWWCVVAAVTSFVAPRSLGQWMTVVVLSPLVPIVWSIVLDLRWLRAGQGRTLGQAAMDVTALRLVTWGAGVAWFFGIAIWYGELPKLAIWWGR